MTSRPSWIVINSGKADASENMALDMQLLEDLTANPEQPILHLYDWNHPSITYGYFTDPSRFLNVSVADQMGIQLARRPTGGGITFHLTDFAFSILIPANHEGYSANILDNYAYVNQIVMEFIRSFRTIEKNNTIEHSQITPECSLLTAESDSLHSDARHFCMAKPTKYDVMIDGLKVGGAAQRRKKQGFLHQGTISLSFPNPDLLERLLLPGTSILQAMRENTFSLLPANTSSTEILRARLQFQQIMESTVF